MTLGYSVHNVTQLDCTLLRTYVVWRSALYIPRRCRFAATESIWDDELRGLKAIAGVNSVITSSLSGLALCIATGAVVRCPPRYFARRDPTLRNPSFTSIYHRSFGGRSRSEKATTCRCVVSIYSLECVWFSRFKEYLDPDFSLFLSLYLSFEQISTGNFRWNIRYKDFLFFYSFSHIFSRSIELLKIRYCVCRSFPCATHTLLWIPFDLRACLPCYANIKPAAFAIGPACPRLVSASALFYRTRASIFLLRKKNKRKEIKCRKSETCSIESEACRYHRMTDEW